MSAPMNLKEIQKRIGEAITLSKGIEQVTSWIADGSSAISREERFAVYADAWFLRLEESLSDDYSSLRKFLSEEAWTKILRSYFLRYPSRSHTLARLGDRFPEHLATQDFAPWLVELAQVELDLCRSSTAHNEKLFDMASLQSMSVDDAEKLQLVLQPSVFLHSLRFNTLDALRNNGGPPPSEGSHHAVIFRELGFAKAESINSDQEFNFLTRLSRPATLGELADELGDVEWVAWLSKWSQRGVIGPI